MKILIDMNLSPGWCEVLARHGWEVVHWSSVGDPKATDAQIMSWAKREGFIVLTHDLDFGALLVATRQEGPSVVQVRTQDVSPRHLEPLLVAALRQFEGQLEKGAIVVVDQARLRARLLQFG